MSREIRADGSEPTEYDSDVEAAIREDHPALITYITAGDPSLEDTKAYVEALDRGGSDLIELGLPFSEPIAEGPTIQAAINRALEAGTTPAGFFELVDDLETEAPLLVMTYYNMILQFGDEPDVRPFVERAAEAGLSGIIVPDLPAEEADPLSRGLRRQRPRSRLHHRADDRGRTPRYNHHVAGLGLRLRPGPARDDRCARERFGCDPRQPRAAVGVRRPKAVGFGVSKGDHAAEIIEAGADGVIVGSALVDILASSETPEAAVDALEAKARELKHGAQRGATDAAADAVEDPPETEHP